MKERRKKLQIKGFMLGVLLMALLMPIAVAVTAQTITRQITYGVGVMLNGEILHFGEDSRPFIMDGRTFLPLRALADLLDLPVDFDPAANMVILGTRTLETRFPLNTRVPAFDRGFATAGPIAGSPSSEDVAFVNMGGRAYANAITYNAGSRFSWNAAGPVEVFTLHNLEGRYSRLTGYAGRVDGSSTDAQATLNIFGDGRLLRSYELNPTALPIHVDVFVEGIRQLRIEFEFRINAFYMAEYAFVGFVE